MSESIEDKALQFLREEHYHLEYALEEMGERHKGAEKEFWDEKVRRLNDLLQNTTATFEHLAQAKCVTCNAYTLVVLINSKGKLLRVKCSRCQWRSDERGE